MPVQAMMNGVKYIPPPPLTTGGQTSNSTSGLSSTGNGTGTATGAGGGTGTGTQTGTQVSSLMDLSPRETLLTNL